MTMPHRTRRVYDILARVRQIKCQQTRLPVVRGGTGAENIMAERARCKSSENYRLGQSGVSVSMPQTHANAKSLI